MPRKYKILIIEDDTDLREIIAEELMLLEEFYAIETGTAKRGLESIKSDLPDLIILDLSLPDGHGLDVLKVIRDQGVTCPIVVLTAETDEVILVKGLEMGANDFVIKPFSFPVLLARIRTHIGQHEMSGEAVFVIGGNIIHPRKKLLVDVTGRKSLFTEKEIELLKYLYRANEKVVNANELYREVWGASIQLNTHTLESHIYRLRRKIEPNSKIFIHLITCDGGYKLIH
jgi:DNA-binding response OmpR family regulator